MSLDFSNKPELAALSHLVRALQRVADPLGIPFFLMGAAARDLMVHYAHGIELHRATQDADFAVMVRHWKGYGELRSALIGGRDFSSQPGPATHRLHHRSGMPLDIVPFGGIERQDRTFAWPPDEREVFDCFGVDEAFAASVEVTLPEETLVRVAPVTALAILKITAWRDRKYTHPGRDARDLFLFLRHYMDLGNLDRAAAEHPDLFAVADFDHVEAGATLLGRDMVALVGEGGCEPLLSILRPETDEQGALLLAAQSGMEIGRARRLLEVLCAGLEKNG